ncbi:HipA N-terminal domain-containing protein [Cryobacterium sp. TMS1-20-1]|uniref:HipA N-terminal domain-containing protein n=1 Tax=Cryobacterium sp. TMS1-20-1 TaxID=1259223 RepID=UPI0021027B3A|nr:HipA N-terminal domain-containing protein [Cryobacterium sp. TMS1-20-1]
MCLGLGSTILSASVPFDLVSNRSREGRRRNFFAELLPEGTALDDLAAEIRVSSDDTIALLAQFGRDIAGAIQTHVIKPPCRHRHNIHLIRNTFKRLEDGLGGAPPTRYGWCTGCSNLPVGLFAEVAVRVQDILRGGARIEFRVPPRGILE